MSVILSKLWRIVTPLTLLPTNVYGVLPNGDGFIVNLISDPENEVTPDSKIPSKLVSINKRLSGSCKVMFLSIGAIFTVKNSPSTMV